ncbi:folate-binding protein [Paracoccaceae bacterium]|nr:folate-binding protein [Paracoccaceae bacterium]
MIKTGIDDFFFVDRNRATLAIEGEDKIDFLQALTTNNVEKVSIEGIVYTAILSPQGKYLFDFFVFSPSNKEIFIDIHQSRAVAFKKFLEFYKLNSDVTIFDKDCQVVLSSVQQETFSFADPRSNILGWRSYDFNEEFTNERRGVEEFETNRIKSLIPETGVELIPEESYILELNFEKIKGVDFKKGCYIGQEVTARMKHKAKLKSRLYCGHIPTNPENKVDKKIYFNSKVVGEIYSIFNNYCLIKIKEDFKEEKLTVFGQPITLVN